MFSTGGLEGQSKQVMSISAEAEGAGGPSTISAVRVKVRSPMGTLRELPLQAAERWQETRES